MIFLCLVSESDVARGKCCCPLAAAADKRSRIFVDLTPATKYRLEPIDSDSFLCGLFSFNAAILKATKKAGLAAQWAKTPFAVKLAKRETRANLNDLQRFQVMINRKRRSAAIRKASKAISKKK